MAKATTFDDILLKGVKRGQIPARTKESREWYRRAARKTTTSPEKIMDESKTQLVSKVDPGEMYMFFYNPKHKEKLPYYDRFPLIFMVGPADAGFYGINLHYLPPRLRAQLMDGLYTLRTDSRYDNGTKLALSYKLLTNAAKFKYFQPCFKHYLSGHVGSRFIRVASVEWDMALFLPTEKFEKASKQQVWSDSRRAV